MKLIQEIGVKDFGTYKKRVGIYECPRCKKHFEKTISKIKRGKIKHCKSCSVSIANETHNMTNTRLYRKWVSMKNRCYREKSQYFNIYGGRGIKMCDEWKNNFSFFLDWSISNGYEENLTIDRIDHNGDYEPSNCRWTTTFVQARNTRLIMATNKSGYRGVSLNNGRWLARITAGKKICLGSYDTAKEAGYAYDKYVIDNNLEHTTNGLYIKETT